LTSIWTCLVVILALACATSSMRCSVASGTRLRNDRRRRRYATTSVIATTVAARHACLSGASSAMSPMNVPVPSMQICGMGEDQSEDNGGAELQARAMALSEGKVRAARLCEAELCSTARGSSSSSACLDALSEVRGGLDAGLGLEVGVGEHAGLAGAQDEHLSGRRTLHYQDLVRIEHHLL